MPSLDMNYIVWLLMAFLSGIVVAAWIFISIDLYRETK